MRGNAQHGRRLVRRSIFIAQDIKKHQVGYGEGVHDAAGDNPPETIDTLGNVKKPGERPIAAEKDDQAHPM